MENTEDFADEEEEGQNENNVDSEGRPMVTRARLPRGREIIGILDQRLGGNKMMINCLDGKSRNCRVPGRLKRKLWLRPNDVVLVEPWELDFNRADIIFKYPPNQIAWLRKKGYLSDEKKDF